MAVSPGTAGIVVDRRVSGKRESPWCWSKRAELRRVSLGAIRARDRRVSVISLFSFEKRRSSGAGSGDTGPSGQAERLFGAHRIAGCCRDCDRSKFFKIVILAVARHRVCLWINRISLGAVIRPSRSRV